MNISCLLSIVLSWQYLTYNGGDCYKKYIVNIIGKFITGNMRDETKMVLAFYMTF